MDLTKQDYGENCGAKNTSQSFKIERLPSKRNETSANAFRKTPLFQN